MAILTLSQSTPSRLGHLLALFTLVAHSPLLCSAAKDTSSDLCGPLHANATCPKSTQCCSRYGYCGNDISYCASGCNPAFSFEPAACFPVPACAPKTFTFGDNGNATIVALEKYTKVDPENVDFIIDTGDLRSSADGAILTLKTDKVGTKITHTRAMRYGRMSLTAQTAWSGGVVSAGVLMGDTDEGEVDIEWVGSMLSQVQSNIFYNRKANAAKHNLHFSEAGTDTSTSFQEYSIDWTSEKVVWGYNGGTLRTVTPSQNYIPQLPMYVQMSIWPGGESTAEGTRYWAGGKINWDDSRFLQQNSTFEFIIKSISIDCYDTAHPEQAYQYVPNKNPASTGGIDVKVIDAKGFGFSNTNTNATQTSATETDTSSSTTNKLQRKTKSKTKTSTQSATGTSAASATTDETSATSTSTNSRMSTKVKKKEQPSTGTSSSSDASALSTSSSGTPTSTSITRVDAQLGETQLVRFFGQIIQALFKALLGLNTDAFPDLAGVGSHLNLSDTSSTSGGVFSTLLSTTIEESLPLGGPSGTENVNHLSSSKTAFVIDTENPLETQSSQQGSGSATSSTSSWSTSFSSGALTTTAS